MAFTKDETDRITQAILARSGPTFLCWVCKTSDWELQDGPLALVVQKRPEGPFELTGPALPLAVLVCRTCGHTVTFSLFKLGLEDVLRKRSTP